MMAREFFVCPECKKEIGCDMFFCVHCGINLISVPRLIKTKEYDAQEYCFDCQQPEILLTNISTHFFRNCTQYSATAQCNRCKSVSRYEWWSNHSGEVEVSRGINRLGMIKKKDSQVSFQKVT
jgi:hypothetical protein